jgi:hypothetical protein
MKKWTGVHHAFAVKVYYKNGYSIVCAQRLFQCHFQMNRIDPVPSTPAMDEESKKWVLHEQKNSQAK